MQRRILAFALMSFVIISIMLFVCSTLILGIPLWWTFRYLRKLSIIPITVTSEFLVTVDPDSPSDIGEMITVTVVNDTSKLPVEGARVSCMKDGKHILDYYTDSQGQTSFEYLGEVTVILVQKEGFSSLHRAVPKLPDKWVRDQNNAFLSSISGGLVGALGSALATYMLQKRRNIGTKTKVRDLKIRMLKVEYGPSSEPARSSIDLLAETPNRLSLENYSLDELEVEVVHDIPPEAYSQTDRSMMPDHYLCAGSIGVIFYRPDGKVASLYLADFLHSYEHHNPWLWGWNFQEKSAYDKEKAICDKRIPDHDTIPLEEELRVSLIVGDKKICDTFTAKHKEE